MLSTNSRLEIYFPDNSVNFCCAGFHKQTVDGYTVSRSGLWSALLSLLHSVLIKISIEVIDWCKQNAV